MESKKNEVGRPAVTLDDLPNGWRDIMHSIYCEGGSDAEVKCALAIPPSRAMSNDLFDDLQKREPEFSEAVKEGKLLAECWWQRKGRDHLITPDGIKFSSALWFINMKNRFGWKDKQDPQSPIDPNAVTEVTVIIDN